ncbi:MAG: LysE family translocator [Protaetiibacter sp.]
MFGIQAGTLVWGAVAAVGVSALLLASQLAYDILRFAGALYLVWIGLRMLWSAIRGGAHGEPATRSDSFWMGFRQGAATNLLNPKVGAFYVAMLPQFIPVEAPHLSWGLALAGVHVLLGTVLLGTLWLGTLPLMARSFRGRLQRRTVARWIDGVAGAVITAFGVRLTCEQ